MGETSRSFNKRIYDHRRDLQRVDINNGLVEYNWETKISLLLVCIHDIELRKTIQSNNLLVLTEWCWKFTKSILIFDGNIQDCTSVVYWPSIRPNMPFQRRGSCIFHWRGRAWLTIWDGIKIPMYIHRLMHRKRVTCELHDSYFRSITTKHAIPKTAEVHIPMASYWEILSGRELLYNLVHKKFNQFWRPDQLVTRCGRESQHPAESWPPGLPLSNPLTHNPFK